ncbi:hypothetical protein Tco_0928255 [Tanacetum coccineum]
MYERQKKYVQDFMPIGSERDKKMIDKMNKKADGMDEEEVPEEPVSTKVKVEQESTKKRKLGTRKKMKSRKRRFRQGTSKRDKIDNDIKKENDELRLFLTIASDEDKEVNYEMLDKKYRIIEWKSEYHGIKPQFDETKDLEEINIIDDLCAVYLPVMNKYQDETPEGLVIHMLVEKKYPLRKKVLSQMLELKLESEEDSTMALELIRFVKKLIVELEPEHSDGDGKDL